MHDLLLLTANTLISFGCYKVRTTKERLHWHTRGGLHGGEPETMSQDEQDRIDETEALQVLEFAVTMQTISKHTGHYG